MDDVWNFIKKELKKKGYSLENYIQTLLAKKKWGVQPNAYFLDKDTGKGRELDIKAYYDRFKPDSWSYFILNLLIQCKSLPGNAWIFFSIPQQASIYPTVHQSGLTRFLKLPPAYDFDIFKREGTHFDQSEVLATNYCEIVVDKEKSNKQVNNIWKSVVTLIKATTQEIEEDITDKKKYFDEDCMSFHGFVEGKPFELINIFYPLIVFDGNMYEATFLDDDISLQKREYVELFIDYRSGRYKGKFSIDVINKGRFSGYLKNIMEDLIVFNKRRVNVSIEYEKFILDGVKKYYSQIQNERNTMSG